jgi:DNA (cytosine-5)-methyltransferase 1
MKNNSQCKYKVGSLYAGVGGVCLGFKNAGFSLSWANEFDKYACETYRTNFSHTLYEEDVWKLDPSKLERIDVLTAGFPCQPFSLAGPCKGFEDERGNHFFRVVDFVNELSPSAVLLENVKNLEAHDGGKTFNIISETLQQNGYTVHSKVMNSKDYGNIPQNRQRIYIVALKKSVFGNLEFKFPDVQPLTNTVESFIQNNKVDDRFYYGKSKKMYQALLDGVTKTDTLYQWRRWYVRENKSNVCPTLTANMGTGGHNVPIVKTDFGIRKLTPHECFAFQGFPIESGDYKLPDIPVTQLYKQSGNSVTVPVIERIATVIKSVLDQSSSI